MSDKSLPILQPSLVGPAMLEALNKFLANPEVVCVPIIRVVFVAVL